jgi:O-antigen/teichoic acid export membrane protein
MADAETAAAPGSSPMRPGIGSAVFLAVMVGASGLTLLRMGVVAALLPLSAFATYAMITATGAFLSSIISFGAVEATIKSFPKLVEQGRPDLLRAQSWRIFMVLARRAAIGGVPFYLLGMATGTDWLRYQGLAFLFALTTAGMALIASMQRAMCEPAKLMAGTVFRTVIVFSCVVVAAYFANLTIMLITEACATALACIVSAHLFFPSARRDEAATVTEPPLRASSRDGVMVFLAYTAVNVPFYLDRLFVASVLGLDRAAQYAILALFLTAASLLVNTLAQRIGPEVIRMVHRDGNGRGAMRQVMLWIGLATVLWLTAIGLAGAGFALDALPASLARYRIEPAMLLAIAVSGVLLSTSLLEFLLIALDRETAFMRSAFLFLGLVVIAAAGIYLLHSGLITLMWTLAGCRLFYATCLIFALRSSAPAHIGA